MSSKCCALRLSVNDRLASTAGQCIERNSMTLALARRTRLIILWRCPVLGPARCDSHYRTNTFCASMVAAQTQWPSFSERRAVGRFQSGFVFSSVCLATGAHELNVITFAAVKTIADGALWKGLVLLRSAQSLRSAGGPQHMATCGWRNHSISSHFALNAFVEIPYPQSSSGFLQNLR